MEIALDVHAHLVPVLPERLADIDGVEWVDERLVIDGHRLGIEALYRPEALLEWMTEWKVGSALVSAPPPTYRMHLDEEAMRQWCGYLNDGLRKMCTADRERLHPASHLPTGHPRLAAEVAEAAADAAIACFSMPAAPVGDLTFSDKQLDPLWSALDQLGAFVFIHPGTCCDGRLTAFYLENLLGNPYETTLAAAHLMFGGVLDRHPRIKFCLAHGGGATAALAGRWQRGLDTGRPGIDTAMPPPRSTVRRFYVDSIVHDAAALDFVADMFGPDKVLFGSDWPFPMGLPEPKQQLEGLDAGLRDRIVLRNAVGLLKPFAVHPD